VLAALAEASLTGIAQPFDAIAITGEGPPLTVGITATSLMSNVNGNNGLAGYHASTLAHYLAQFNGTLVLDQHKHWRFDGGSEWGSNPPATGLPAARRF